MKIIKVPNPKRDNLVSQLVILYTAFKGVEKNEALNFDFLQIKWFYPLLVLPIAAYINDSHSEYQGTGDDLKSYLNTIYFPQGVDSVSVFEKEVQVAKSYVPISVLKREKGVDRERLESMFSSMIYKIMGSISGVQNALYYPITELAANIFEHSKRDIGFLFGQFYQNKNYLDICIVDRGRGLARAYRDEKNLEVSDAEAIIEVMKGYSTKPDKERGYGVRTSKRVVCEGLGGEFVLISGNSALICAKNKEKLAVLPEFYWQGVIIGYRIPKPQGHIDISPYLE